MFAGRRCHGEYACLILHLSIKAAILAEAGESLETREGSFLDSMAGPAALEIWKVYQAMNAVVSIAFVDGSSGATWTWRAKYASPGSRAPAPGVP